MLASPIAEHVGMHAMRIVGNLVVDPNEKLIAFDTFWSIKRLFLAKGSALEIPLFPAVLTC